MPFAARPWFLMRSVHLLTVGCVVVLVVVGGVGVAGGGGGLVDGRHGEERNTNKGTQDKFCLDVLKYNFYRVEKKPHSKMNDLLL